MQPTALADRYPTASRWVSKALDLFFPPVCAACGTLGALVCDQCQAQMLTIPEPLCHRCGRSLLYAAPVCRDCMQPSFVLQQVRASFAYKEPVSHIIKRLKYEGLFALAKPLALIMAGAWPDWDSDPDAILPIPLHKRRERERGFNQSAFLARYMGCALGIPVYEEAIKRERNTKPQTGLSPDKRQENVRDAFIAEPKQVEGKQIVLIDDVYTTGATMSEAANALLASGAKGVSAYCLARAV